jgi:hypothetical protein
LWVMLAARLPRFRRWSDMLDDGCGQTSAVRGVLSSALAALRSDREQRELLRKRRLHLEKRIMELEQTIIVLKGS